MNAAYAYNNQEAAFLITSRIYYLLEQNHWSVKTLSDKSNIPYETLKKLLSRKTENTSFHNIMKIALAFNCNLNYFVEPFDNNTMLQTSKIEIPIFNLNSSIKSDKDHSVCPSSEETLNLSSYPEYIQNQVQYSIAVSSHFYHPVYTDGDALLIGCNRLPLPGETGIFLYKKDLYIRTFSPSLNSVLLEPVNRVGPNIIIRDFTEWKYLGYVVGVHKISVPLTFYN